MPFNDETYFFNQALKKYIKIDIDLSSKIFISVHPYYLFIFTFTFMHLADAFIQSDLQYIQAIHFLVSTCVFMMDLRSLLFTSENSININCELKCEIINII